MERIRTPTRATERMSSASSCSLLFYFIVASACLFYGNLVRTLVHHHEQYHAVEERNEKAMHSMRLSRFETVADGELLLQSNKNKVNAGIKADNKNNNGRGPDGPPPSGECAINLFGLPRSFKHHVLPSLVQNVISVNHKYRCDYFVHFFNVTHEESGSLLVSSGRNGKASQYARGGNDGGTLRPDDVYLLKDAIAGTEPGARHNKRQRVEIVSDTNEDFTDARNRYIQEIVLGTGGDQASNPYFVKEASFTEKTLRNILKMWHSLDQVWNLMEQTMKDASSGEKTDAKRYKRVAMLRLDVIYTTPIDIYKIPTDEIPADLNEKYLKFIKAPARSQKAVEYFYDFGTQPQHCVLPGFKSYPVNDRYFVGPYEAVKIWAKDRFSRAHKHINEVLPELESQRSGAEKPKPNAKDNNFRQIAPTTFTDYGLHDETFVAFTILPAIRNSVPGISVRVDRELYFARVRSDGAIWLKDKPGFGRIQTSILEAALGRKCTGKVYEVLDPILKDSSPGRWQIKCPPESEK